MGIAELEAAADDCDVTHRVSDRAHPRAFDVTPQGIQATPKVAGAYRRRDLILLIVAGAIKLSLPRASACARETSTC